MKLPIPRSIAIIGIALSSYIIAYLVIYRFVGLPGALAVVPIVICSWLLDRRSGLIFSILVTFTTVLLILTLGEGWKRVADTWLGLVLLPAVGFAIGWFREIYNHTRAQTSALKQAQTELAQLNIKLEQRVHERTEEIRRLNRDLEKRVAERTEELQAANAQLEAFNSMVAHDLRAPLTVVQSYSDLLSFQFADRALDESGLQMLREIQNASQQMSRLIQDLFDFARAKDAELQRQPIDLTQLAEEIIQYLQRRNPARSVTWQVQPGLSAQGDERLLRILLINLLDNAWKYSGPATQARVEFGSDAQSGAVVYFVRDNGVGFNMSQAEQLFQPFRRLTEEFPGTGLGLATCKRIVERHGGRIWVESQAGAGTTFFFTMPAG